MSNTKTIAKNTLFLYFRMFLIMGVTLYTSRIILKNLGISDYGIYSLVGGVVATLGFFNAAMSSATQRYLSFDIGQGNNEKLRKTFSATLTIHILIALVILFIAETLGLWYINMKMIFPNERLFAVNVVYQFSIFTFLISVIQVPYNALIVARERMNVYAYVSVIEVLLKLLIVYFLFFGRDKLILFSVMTFIVAIIIRFIYLLYCKKFFPESKFMFEYDRNLFRELLSYSGWNLFGAVASIARNNGLNIVLNLFFGTIINAAYGINLQVQAALNTFVGNFQMAFNPQIIKNYANKEYSNMFGLVFLSSKISFFLLLAIILPLFVFIDKILEIWLNDFPIETIDFIRLSLIVIVIDSLSSPLIMTVQATGRIKMYQIIVGGLLFLNLPISYLMLQVKAEPIFVFYTVICISIVCYFFRVYFVVTLVNMELFKYLKKVLLPIFNVFLSSVICFFILNTFKMINVETILNLFLSCLYILLGVVISVVLFGFSSLERKGLKEFVVGKIKKV